MSEAITELNAPEPSKVEQSAREILAELKKFHETKATDRMAQANLKAYLDIELQVQPQQTLDAIKRITQMLPAHELILFAVLDQFCSQPEFKGQQEILLRDEEFQRQVAKLAGHQDSRISNMANNWLIAASNLPAPKPPVT